MPRYGSNPNNARPRTAKAAAAKSAEVNREKLTGKPLAKTRSLVKDQMAAIEAEVGCSFEEALARSFNKLYKDFHANKHVKEFTNLLLHLANRYTEKLPETQIQLSDTKQLTHEEINERLQKLLDGKGVASTTIEHRHPDVVDVIEVPVNNNLNSNNVDQ